MTFVGILVSVLGIIAWVLVVLYLFGEFISREDRRYALACAVVAAFGLSVLIYAVERDYEDDRLCVRGHQEWVTRSRPALVGRVIVSQTVREKRWACEAWEVER